MISSSPNKINRNDPPLRLFKSDLLEFFTHIHPAVITILWVPVAAFFIFLAVRDLPAGKSVLFIPVAFLSGIFIWSFAEYVLHRFVFHFHPHSAKLKRIVFLFHGIHHEQPLCKTRLVMPPVVSIPLAILFYALFSFIGGILFSAPFWVAPAFSGFITGYLFYDITHYATHHFPVHKGVFYYLKRYHMLHHFKTPDRRFGVSSPLWDLVFRTKPPEAKNLT